MYIELYVRIFYYKLLLNLVVFELQKLVLYRTNCLIFKTETIYESQPLTLLNYLINS